MDSENKSSAAINDCWNRIGVWGDLKDRCPELATVIHCRNCSTYTAAGRGLLDRPVPEDYAREWSSLFARGSRDHEELVYSAFIFRAGGEWFGLDAALVEEVVDLGPIHSLPHRTNNILRGVVNIRGKLELCFSIGGLLGIERFEKIEVKAEKYISPVRLVVVGREGNRVVFPVSEVYGFFRYGEGALQQLPVTVAGSKAAFTRGVLSVDGMDVGLLDNEVLLSALLRSVQ